MNENEIVKKIKSYEDACKVLEEIDKPEEKILAKMKEIQDKPNRNVQLYIQLITITRALNQGWTPQLSHGECHYFIRVNLHRESEGEGPSKQNAYEVAAPSSISNIKYATLRALNNSDVMFSNCGYQFAYKSEVLANGSINNFGELWVEYFTGCPAKKMQV